MPDYSYKEIKTIPVDSSVFSHWKKEYFQAHRIFRLFTIGNPNLLHTQKLGLLCSSKCPGKLILQTHDLMASLHGRNITVVSGFHSPIEKECFNILSRSNVSIIVCPARSLIGMRITPSWEHRIKNGNMLVLSPFSKNYRRQTKNLAEHRNRLVAALSDKLLIPFAAQSSKILDLVEDLVPHNNSIFTFDSLYNEKLIEKGVKPVTTVKDIF